LNEWVKHPSSNICKPGNEILQTNIKLDKIEKEKKQKQKQKKKGKSKALM
jgi:hypothetical protein